MSIEHKCQTCALEEFCPRHIDKDMYEQCESDNLYRPKDEFCLVYGMRKIYLAK